MKLKKRLSRMLGLTSFYKHISIVQMPNGDWNVIKTWNNDELLGAYATPVEAFETILISRALENFKGFVITVDRSEGGV